MLEDLERIAGEVAARVGPSVVRIGRSGRGSGVVVSTGRVVTNAHNLGAPEVSLRLTDGRAVAATVAGADVDGDLVVLSAELEGSPPLAIAERPARLGQPVFAVTAAEGGPRLTFGLVSALGQAFRGPRGRRIGGSIEHTAAMAPGSSGSALVDVNGELLGINTSRVGGGFYRALPADASFRARVDRLAAGQDVERPRLGVTVAPTWAAQRMRAAVGLAPRAGVLVRDVDEDSPAARAGISAGDLIVAVESRAVADADDLGAALEASTAELRIDIVRGEQQLSVSARLAA
jgi:S1-C subfamily serine protease